jgi:LacI family transcriptional regulator
MKRVTIGDVAAACGVSKATVSKALTMDPAVCPVRVETRALVLATAERLGYRAGWLASALTRGRTGTVALLYTRPTPPMMGQNFEIVRALQSILASADIDLVLQRVEEGSPRSADLIASGRYDGVVVFEHFPSQLTALLTSGRLPVVLLNAHGPTGIPSICPNDDQAAVMAAEHFHALGHRRVRYWHGPYRDAHFSATVRSERFVSAAQALGMVADAVVASAADLLSGLDTRAGRVTAVVCFHELLATELLQACWRAGVQVPRDLAVLTFNDSYIGHFLVPPLSAVAMPAIELGERAAKSLLARMAGTRCASQVVPVTRLLARASSTPTTV